MNEDVPGKGGAGTSGDVAYRLCPRCLRAVPLHSREQYCVNDGARLLEGCPRCGEPITSPYAHFCARCGEALSFRVDNDADSYFRRST
ncbi:double zinc ribbon protein [Deinococcus yavapaiensis KR-236]|uniref:Double zinc ribbon protein n=1 Tax=Deinococcus yavapaiensis KR-236 TaxID=694435 RepID=A0A318S2V2_9DEIO|nr:double zinc ribbon protein [Deinococcus yavapaiensis KR-236]